MSREAWSPGWPACWWHPGILHGRASLTHRWHGSHMYYLECMYHSITSLFKMSGAVDKLTFARNLHLFCITLSHPHFRWPRVRQQNNQCKCLVQYKNSELQHITFHVPVQVCGKQKCFQGLQLVPPGPRLVGILRSGDVRKTVPWNYWKEAPKIFFQ